MTTHSSATTLEESPHVNESTNNSISDAVKRRARNVINDRTIDPQTRALIRYGFEINDPWLASLVQRVDAGETIDDMDFSQMTAAVKDSSSEEKVEALAEMICRGDDLQGTKCIALLVLMATLEHSDDPRALANIAKHFAFTRCGELNLSGIVDAQIATFEGELFPDTSTLS